MFSSATPFIMEWKLNDIHNEGKNERVSVKVFPDCAITYHTCQHTAGSRSSKTIIARMHTWQQCSVTTSEDILTTKYGFNLQQNSPLNIDNNTRILWLDTCICRACVYRSAITEVGTFLKRHTLVPSLTIPLHSVAWIEKGRGNKS